MNGRFILFLVLGLIYVADIFYKIFTCPSCDGDYFGFVVPAIVDFALKAFFAFVLLKAANKARQKAVK